MATQSAQVDKDTRDFKTIKVEVSGPLGRLILNRPERLNAIGATILQELAEAARWFDSHRELRVVIVSGVGRAFSVGADLRDSPTGSGNADASWQFRREVGQYGLARLHAIEQDRAVTIAQVQGFAVGGGLVLMALCDLRIAADDAVFFIPEIDLGVPLAWGGIPRLVREIGPALTKELVMTCRRFSPAEAKAAGFLNRAVPANQLEREVNELAAEIVAKPSVPVIITKEHVNAVTRAMSGGILSFADGDLLLASIGEAESKEAARNYTKKALGIEGKL